MTKLTRAARTLAAVAVTVGLLGLAAPAQAERYSIEDPADAQASLNDVYELTYVHGEKRVRFVITVDDLRPVADAGATLYLDTKPKNKGPEYALGTGLSSGTDYALVRVKGWEGNGSDPIGCDYQLRLRYRTDKVVGSIARKCLGNPSKVAAAVKMVDTYDGSHPVTDWAPAKKTFGLRVAAG